MDLREAHGPLKTGAGFASQDLKRPFLDAIYLGGKLVDAWWAERERVGEEVALYLPYAENGEARAERIPVPSEREEAEVWARRLVAERCIYGVDKNPLAVEMAKLSLWLVTLSRDKPFSFLDHALKSGDSLLGLSSLDQLRTWSLDGKGTDVYITTERVEEAVALRAEIQKMPVAAPEDVEVKERLHSKAEESVKGLRALGNLLYSTVIAEENSSRQSELQARRLSSVVDRLGDSEAILGMAQKDLRGHRPFHWPLEFPEVFERKEMGIDAFVGNPPYLGGRRISTVLGTEYNQALSRQHPWTSKNTDLCAHFFLRAFRLLSDGGNFGLLAINTIAEGDTRRGGLEWILRNGGILYSAHHNEPWPNQAAVVTSRVHAHKGKWEGIQHLSGLPTDQISAFLSCRDEWTPKRLAANGDLAYQGSIVLGKGFLLSEEDAQRMLRQNPRNKDVVLPFLIGKDLNSDPKQRPSRWVINFWDWPEALAKRYQEPYLWLRQHVYPERLTKSSQKSFRTIMNMWWLHWRPRPELYHSIGRGHHFSKHPASWDSRVTTKSTILVCSEVTKFLSFSFIENSCIVSANADVFATQDYGMFSILQSWLHATWAWKQSSKLETRLKYSPGNAFETFPLPHRAQIDVNYARLISLGETYHQARRETMVSWRVGLTDLYNRFHNSQDKSTTLRQLRELQVEIDQAVAQAYGWDDLDLGHDFHEVPYLPENDRIRFTVSEPARLEILDRLSQLNRERYEEEVAQGLHDKKKRKPARKRKKPKAAPAETAPLLPFSPREPSEPYPAPDQDHLLEVAEPAAEYKLWPEDEAAAPAAEPPLDSQATPAECIRAWLDTHPGWHARAEIIDDLDLSPGEWNPAIRELVEFGEVERKGRKRGTRYRAKRA